MAVQLFCHEMSTPISLCNLDFIDLNNKKGHLYHMKQVTLKFHLIIPLLVLINNGFSNGYNFPGSL